MFGKKIKAKKRYLAFLVLLFVICTVVAYKTIQREAAPKVYGSVSEVPETQTALLLGTGKTLKSGQPNAYFFNRIEAVVALYQAGKIKNVIISGDNSRADYNEPEDMKQELMKRGVPEERIYLDFAGFRTLDSVVRCKEIFGQDQIIIVSQQFHNERAVYIAEHYGIKAIAFNAKDVNAYAGFKTQLREFLARDKVFIDFLCNVKPKFLGDKVVIH
ncbi:YdcF family protein [Flavobacterium sp. NRK F10]|uniref:SanA/YdcF family protein n=1 Tax=Flavobacterium sp. NRK F10 TaxID=2954931 RepID=UPI0020908DCA|nr:ElyC/SanA/YdcF family protein [Flavobacterium sp. NRK F10]MCO6173644.1 YdcF family protein [Flavobacterium sp. NRK F10]